MRRTGAILIFIILVMAIFSPAVYAASIYYTSRGFTREYQGSALCESSWINGVSLSSPQGVTNWGRIRLKDATGKILCIGSEQVLLSLYKRDFTSGSCLYDSSKSYRGDFQWRYFDLSNSTWLVLGNW